MSPYKVVIAVMDPGDITVSVEDMKEGERVEGYPCGSIGEAWEAFLDHYSGMNPLPMSDEE